MEDHNKLGISLGRVLMKALPVPLYTTAYGAAYLGDASDLLRGLPDSTVDLILTSPPFALQRQKEYGNRGEREYVDWLLSFTLEVKRVLKDTGSFVLDLGGAYLKGRPVRSLYNYRVLLRLCDEQGWNLAEEFFWFNPAKLPSPIEWVNKRKIRAKDAVDTVWWLSKSDSPKANVSQVLTPYSDRMKRLLENGDKYYLPKKRPSGHDISIRFMEDKGGAIPSNLLQISNTESNYSTCAAANWLALKAHPARFPQKLPEFFIRFLTEVGDTVLDVFAGSNTTGAAAENLRRKWIAFELERDYLAASAFRFLDQVDGVLVQSLYARLANKDASGVTIPQAVLQAQLLDKKKPYIAGTDPES